MKKNTTYVGLDVHKAQITVCVLRNWKTYQWQLQNNALARRRMLKKVRKISQGCEIRCCYEAGSMGFVLFRELQAKGVDCIVVAPSLIPRKPGERIKTDRRDAKKLAELHSAGLLTEVHPPTEEEESVRDLSRAREDAMEDRKRCRHRLLKFLNRHGYVFRGGKNWGSAHMLWLRGLKLERQTERQVFENYLLALDQATDRHDDLVAHLEEVAKSPKYQEHVGWLRCFRGIDILTAMTILTEIHDFRRFQSPRELSAYLGLVPSEHTSDGHRRQGSITKTGNRHVRRILVEAAHHAYRRPIPSRVLKKRRQGQPAAVISIADRAMHRMYRRFHHLLHRGKHRNKIITALARELSGFIWAVLYQLPMQSEVEAQ